MKSLLAGVGLLVLFFVVGTAVTPVPQDESVPDKVAMVRNEGSVVTQISESANSIAEEAIAIETTGTNAEIEGESVAVAADIETENLGEQSAELYQVVRVVDGDTIEVETDSGVMRVRYIGVDTPETVHPSKPVECMGREASDYNKQLVAGKLVRLENDISDTDRYGRWLRYVYVDGVFINEALVANGYAKVVTYPPDVKYIEQFRAAEGEARVAEVGLWSGVCAGSAADGITPAPVAAQKNSVDATCRIKGNISSSGEKIFHVPGCQSYDKTVISEAAGEQWFCSEADAVAAGWRKALNCL